MAQFDSVCSTGKEHQRFDSGSRRDSAQGKGRPDLLPVHALIRTAKVCDPEVVPIHGIHRLSVHYENGAVKYGDRNWELGQPLSRYYSSMFRHLQKWVGGAREEDHLAAVVWNGCAIMDHEERIKRDLLDHKWDDMPKDEHGKIITAFIATDIVVAPWSPDGMKISEHAWVAFNHMIWWLGGDRTVDHVAIVVRAGMSMITIEERVERGLLGSDFLDLEDMKIFLPGEFLEADRKRKEAEAAEKVAKPVLLVEEVKSTKRGGPGPDPDSLKRYVGEVDHEKSRPATILPAAAAEARNAPSLGSKVTEAEV